MSTFLTFDIGNSHPHVGHFEGTTLQASYSLGHFENHILPRLEHYSYAISNVGKKPEALLQKLGPHLVNLRSHWRQDQFFGMPLKYAPTLGDDRLFESAYVWQLLKTGPHSKALLIDAGTFITFDWLHKNEGHLGGVISPGAATFLHNYARGEQLSLYKPDDISWSNQSELPLTTKDAILTGARWYLEAMCHKVITERPVEIIYVTGGHANYVENICRDFAQITVVNEPHLIHLAMKALADQIGH